MKPLPLSVKEKADKIASATIEALGAVSVQYAISLKDEVILSASVGKFDSNESRPLSSSDMYGVGSTSKMYVTAAVMLLVNMGKLDIDKPLKNYVPDFEMADPRYVKITPRHLMNHSSGIYGSHFKGSFLFEDNNTFAIDNLLRHLKNCTLKYEPGAYMEYCNDGFQLLEILVERVGGLKFNKFLSKYFFEPLGAKNTKTPLDDFDINQMARFLMPAVYDGDLPYEMTNLLGTGGIISTAEDLCLFGQVLMGKKILSEKSAKMMGEKEYLNGEFWVDDAEETNLFAYGLGYDHVNLHPFNKSGVQALVKGGDTMMYHASLIVIPEFDIAAASVSTGGISLTNNILLVEALKDICTEYGLIKEFPPEPAFTPPVKVEMPDEYLKYEGLYSGQELNLLIEIKDGEIDLPAMLQSMVPPAKYVYAGEGKFTSPDGKNTIFFSEVKDGLTFIQCNFNIDLPGVGIVVWKAFNFQKLSKNPISAEVAAVWEKRKGKKYILADELPTSGVLLNLSTPHSEIKLDINTEYGYVNGAKIINENFAKNVLYARDIFDCVFYTDNGDEYLIARNQHHIDSDAIREPCADFSAVTIADNGLIKYFKVGDELAGKTITVTLPADASFAVYSAIPAEPTESTESTESAEGTEPETPEEPAAPPTPLKLLTTVTGNKPIQLEKGDLLMFCGAAGSRFDISLFN